MDLKNLSSNWKKLHASGALKLNSGDNSTSQKDDKHSRKESKPNNNLRRKRKASLGHSGPVGLQKKVKRTKTMSEEQIKAEEFVKQKDAKGKEVENTTGPVGGDRINEGLAKNVDIVKYLAIDCEMVGIGPHPHLESALARASVVNYDGEQVYDSYVKPQEEVTDWRTHVSGIQPKHMIHARSLEEVQTDIAALIKGRIVVGHSVRGDFEALFLDHPKRDVRDTARHPPYRKLAGGGSPKLKILASELLGLDIQAGEHSSIEDARATMLLFRRDKEAFEREHVKKWGLPVVARKANVAATDEDSAKKSKKKKKRKK